jgi:hypothetical protein
VATPAQADPLQDNYLSTRNRYIADFKKIEDSGNLGGDFSKKQEQALSILQKQMDQIIGRLSLKGFPAQGKLTLDTLSVNDVGFDTLDGLLYISEGDKSQVIVTTKNLFDAWLLARRKLWAKPDVAPKTLEEALTSQEFYTFAISADAAVSKFAELPLEKPAGVDTAYALLDARSQDVAPRTPDEIIVSFTQDGKLFIASAPVQTKIGPIAACEKIANAIDARAKKALAAYEGARRKNEKLFDDYTRLETKSDVDYRKCYGEEIARQPFLPRLKDEAQALLSRLAAR